MFTPKSRRSLRLLSIDNGGMGGLSPLLILREILLRIKQQEGLPEIPRPCDVFDLAGGAGTGGIIVIMLFRLQMSIDAAIEAYINLWDQVFSEKKWFFQQGTFKATLLEEAMLKIIQQSEDGDPLKVPLLNEDGPKCFVSAVYSHDQVVYFPSFLCSWASNSTEDILNRPCTVVEAVRATTAVVNFFKPARVEHVFRTTYFDVDLLCNNPTQHVVDKAKELYGDRPISCLLSLGTGYLYVISQLARSRDPFKQRLPTKLLRTLQVVVTNCEEKSREIAREFSRHSSSIFYCRLNDYCERRSPAEWKRVSYGIHYHVKPWHPGWNLDQLLQALKDKELAATDPCPGPSPQTGLGL